MSTRSEKRDPIKDDPLHDPAESLKEQRDELLNEKVLFWMIFAVMFVFLAVFEWYHSATSMPPRPIYFSVLAAAVCALAVYRISKLVPKLRNLGLGIRGERSVGQLLQRDVVPLGYRVFHDIVDGNHNIDHVAIGPGGIFAIETKTRSKRAGNPKVRFDGKRVTVDGFVPDRDPVVQAHACAASLGRILELMPHSEIRPFPVVLYPGWMVKEASKANIWVLNEKVFVSFLRNEPTKLSEQQIDEFSKCLEQYVRASQTPNRSHQQPPH